MTAKTHDNQPTSMASGHRVIRTETSNPELHAVVPVRAKRLLRTPAPFERESLLPYALRLSEANGYLTPGYFLTASNATQFVVSRHLAVTLIRESADLDEGQMARLIYASVEDDATSGRLLGKRIGLYDLQLRSPRICPACVDENGHIEALWDLAWVTACPVHARKLLDTCPVCSTRFSWSRPGIAKCPQGHDVTKFVCAEATHEEVGIACFLARKLYGDMVPGYPDQTGGSHLSALPLYETCRLAAKLANFQSMRTSTTKRIVRGRSNLISHAGSMVSLHALLCGSSRDREMLFEALSIDPATGAKHRSFHDAFNWLLTLFPKERAVEFMSPLLKELFAFAAEHWSQSRLGRTAEAFQPFVAPSKWMSATAAAKKIGVIESRIMQGIAKGDIPHKQVSDKPTHHLVVPVAWVVEQAAVPRRSMHSKRLRKLFSFSTRVLEILRENRIYTPSIKSNFGKILEHDIRLLADRLLHGSTEKINSASTRDVTFHDLMYGHTSDASKAAIVMAILNGSLKSKGNVAGRTLPGLLFDKREAQRFRIVQEVLIRDEVQLGDAARILDCRNVKALIDSGHLEVSSTRGSQTFVTKDSIESFSASYMAARPVLAEAGIAIATLLKVARFAGIQLLSVQDPYRKGRTWFIPRAEQDALLSAVPRFKDCSPPRANWPSERKRAALVLKSAVRKHRTNLARE